MFRISPEAADAFDTDENGRPIWPLAEDDPYAWHLAEMEAAKRARDIRKVGRLLNIAIVPGFAPPRPVRKAQLARWLARGMTGAEAAGSKGVGQRLAFIAFEAMRERGPGKRGHAHFERLLNQIASKSPELHAPKTGRSRIACGPEAERAWRFAKAKAAALKDTLRGNAWRDVLGACDV